MKVVEIKRTHIQDIIDDLTKEGKKNSTLDLYKSRVNLTFKFYIENYNPNFSSPVYNIVLPKTDKKIKKALTKSELDDLLLAISDAHREKLYIICLIAGTCGLRRGEILGLTWDNLDFENSKLTINKQWKYLPDGTMGFGTVKNKNGKRTIPVPKSTLEILRNYKETVTVGDDNRIVPSHLGSFVKWNKYLKKIAGISIHELRHTYATLLISNDIDFKTAAKLLGDDVKQIIKTYSHVTDDMIKNATNKIEKIF